MPKLCFQMISIGSVVLNYKHLKWILLGFFVQIYANLFFAIQFLLISEYTNKNPLKIYNLLLFWQLKKSESTTLPLNSVILAAILLERFQLPFENFIKYFGIEGLKGIRRYLKGTRKRIKKTAVVNKCKMRDLSDRSSKYIQNLLKTNMAA